MYKRTIRYEDFDGNIREEDFYFNISKAEMAELELTYPGGYAARLDRIAKSNDRAEIFKAFKDIIEMSYGEKSEDGRRFVKSKEISDNFIHSAAYSEFLYALATDDGKTAAEFVNGIMPNTGISDDELYEKTKALIDSKKIDTN